ncbi:DUF4383 domain-containing protein [Salinibacterium sp. ZJ450]|uniref:DUF4383 domain-containing protein n=1 Tax=Salinibacterium sp. ZJ450 TaxID=2708338 RepID=UPI00141DADD7|nr:DUF4383 domain-containing protein [Salinibacterium sp. ZJ450]
MPDFAADGRRPSPNRMMGAIVGALLLLIGILGFAVTWDVPIFGTPGALLFGQLEVNPAQNLLHLLGGAALITAAATSIAAARTTNAVGGALSLLLGLTGLFLVGSPANFVAVSPLGNLLHFAAAVLLLAVGLGVEQQKQR